MPNPTRLADIEARWRRLTQAEEITAAARVDDVWSELTARLPTLESRLAAGLVPAGLVVRVVSDAVLRVLKNPDGFRTETVGGWSGTRDGVVAGIYIDPADLALLAASRPRGGSIRLVLPAGR